MKTVSETETNTYKTNKMTNTTVAQNINESMRKAVHIL